jgi:hypothetical protein
VKRHGGGGVSFDNADNPFADMGMGLTEDLSGLTFPADMIPPGLFPNEPAPAPRISASVEALRRHIIDVEFEPGKGPYVDHPRLGRVYWPGAPEDNVRDFPQIPDDHGYTPPRPSDVARIRRRLAEYYSSPEAVIEAATSLSQGKWTLRPDSSNITMGPESIKVLAPVIGDNPGPAALARMASSGPDVIDAAFLCHYEAERLARASLYYLEDGPTRMAVKLGQAPIREAITLDRAPSRTGFMMFASPIGMYETSMALRPVDPDAPPCTRPVPFVGVSWSPWRPQDTDTPTWLGSLLGEEHLGRITTKDDWVWFTFYTAAMDPFTVYASEEWIWADGGAVVLPAGPLGQSLRVQAKVQPVIWDTEVAVRQEQVPDPGVNSAVGRNGTLMQVVYTAWQLIQQQRDKWLEVKPVTVEAPKESNAARRKKKRRGEAVAPPARPDRVNVVRIAPRTQSGPKNPGEDQRERNEYGHLKDHDHQWTVGDHKRDHCMNPHRHAAGECSHQEKLIIEHFAGPWDKPVKLGKTVKVLKDVPGDPGQQNR